MTTRAQAAIRLVPEPTMDEQQLIRAAAGGDRSAFRTLFEEKRDRVFWTAYQILGSTEDAREVTQQVFIKLWQNLDRYRSSYRFDTWIFRIARNAAIDAYRKRRAQGGHVSLEAEEAKAAPDKALRSLPGQETIQMTGEVQRVFDALAGRLSLKQRTAFTLREIQGVPTREVARIMSTTQSTVRNHVFQARKILQEGLREQFPEYLTGRRDLA